MIVRKWRGRNAQYPEAWRGIVAERLVGWHHLTGEEQTGLLAMAAAFVDQKRWEGAGGLRVTDEMRVVVAVHACLLVRRMDATAFRSVGSIILYPKPVVSHGVRSLGGGIVSEGPLPIHGETRRGGPVVIVWSAAEFESRHPEIGRNVVLHEFAHQLDLQDGALDGTPPLVSRELQQQWPSIRDDVYAHVLAHSDPLLGSYAATNVGELFAVSTERFFTRPVELRNLHPAWYAALAAVYKQDPATSYGRAGR